MTDECYDPNAETECEKFLNLALSINSKNPEPLQLLASFKVSQEKPVEALKILEESYSLWKDLDFELMPSFELRVSTAKFF